jgi:ParB family chromosome partitioning protein
VRRLTDDQMLAIALVENLQRDDLAPLETARGFRTLIREFGLTQAEVAERVGKPRSSVANFLRLLELPDEVQQLLDDRTLEMGHGRALAGLEDRELAVRLARQAASSKWSVRETEERVRRANTIGPVAPREGAAARDPNVAAAEKTLSRALGAKVAIQTSRAGRGRIEIRFAGDEDLDRLYRLLLRASGSQVH